MASYEEIYLLKIAGIRGDIAGRRQMYGQMAGGIGSIIGAGIKGA